MNTAASTIDLTRETAGGQLERITLHLPIELKAAGKVMAAAAQVGFEFDWASPDRLNNAQLRKIKSSVDKLARKAAPSGVSRAQVDAYLAAYRREQFKVGSDSQLTTQKASAFIDTLARWLEAPGLPEGLQR